MNGQIHPQSILGWLIVLVPDPRSRRGRVYPLAAILGMLLLGALEGESLLRGMWMRGKYWQGLMAELGVVGIPGPPELTAVWNVLQRVEVERLGQALGGLGSGRRGALYGREACGGSRREEKGALEVLAIAGQQSGQVVIQREVEGDEGVTAVELLGKIPLAGKVISMDAGLMEQKVVKGVVKKGATILGC